jgi:hypothetical protein
LEVDLLLVDDVFVVEGGVFGVDSRGNGRMEGVRGLSYAGHLLCRPRFSCCILDRVGYTKQNVMYLGMYAYIADRTTINYLNLKNLTGKEIESSYHPSRKRK